MPRGVVEAAGPDNTTREKTVQFRGRKYHLVELDIADYDKIAKLATTKVDIGGGTEVDRLDEQLQSRMLLDKMMVDVDPPLPRSGIQGLGVAVVVGLNRVVNELLYADEKDELLAPKKVDEPAADDDAEAPAAPNA